MAHTTKVMLPTLTFVLIKLYAKSIHPNVAYVNSCIPTLRVASQSGSHLIQYQRCLTGVQRLARKGLKAASCQIEPGEENRNEPQRPRPTPFRNGQGHFDLSHSILTSSQTYRISIEERPTGHLRLAYGSSICREVG
jgi:hypothetical protein